MKKLLYIRGRGERSIDECLMVVEENYDKKSVLERAEESGVDEPYIASVIELDVDAFVELPAEERPYVG